MLINFVSFLGSPFKCPVIGSSLDGPTAVRVGNIAYMDLDMPGLDGTVSAEVTGTRLCSKFSDQFIS